MQRYDVTAEQWDLIRGEFPPSGPTGGRPRREARDVLNAILWILHTGSPWRALPRDFVPWQTAYRYFAQWARNGTFERVALKLQTLLRSRGLIDTSLWCVDSTSIRASQAAAGAPKRGTLGNRRTTRWGARGEGLARSSTSSRTAEGSRWALSSPPAKRASATPSDP
jgi:transposase